MNDPLLTIAIPTYNRAEYLDKCLASIFHQLNTQYYSDLEIFVSNNASTDNTKEIIEKYARFPLIHILQKENIGGDNNIAWCFEKASGKYTWVLGDDDFLFPDTLNKIILLLKQQETGVLYLNNLWYDKEDEIRSQNINDLNCCIYHDPATFFERVNIWVTFISANIINKRALLPTDWLNMFKETKVRQLAWTIPAIFKSGTNIFVEDKILACKGNNSNGYSRIKVFGEEFNTILDYFISNGYSKKIKPVINNHLITEYFPGLVNPGLRDKESRKAFFALIPIFWRYASFWKIYLIRPLRRKFKI